MNDIKEEYFEWLYGIVCSDKQRSYHYLLDQLFYTEFRYSHPMDSNRASDGRSLRYTWGRSSGYADYIIENTLDIYPCSVLEVLVALSLRCEEQITYDSTYGDRTSKWIWIMLRNLNLENMYDENYHEEMVSYVLDKWMDRQYNYDGSNGGIFVIKDPRADLRLTDIWYQAMWYLTERLKEGKK